MLSSVSGRAEVAMSYEYFTDNDDAVRDGCGVFGIYGPGQDVARITFFGLFALQHRGQESAGIAVSDGCKFSLVREMGLVSQIFDEAALSSLHGFISIGHTRYSTTGSSLITNAQPIVVESRLGQLAIAHNGNLINATELRDELVGQGAVFVSTTDSEVIARLLAAIAETADTMLEVIRLAMQRMRGAYAVVAMTNEALYGFRDPWGIRPMCLGLYNDEHYVLASESCAMDVIGADFIQEVGAGECVMIDGNEPVFHTLSDDVRPSMCIFEFIYVARPDSHIYGRSLHLSRRRMGQELAREHPVEADIVISIPDSGTPAAIGYAEASHIPYGEGLIKSRYIHRTFIQPDQRLRELGVRMKLNPLREALSGKRVVVVDDSIIRGTTTRKIVKLLRESGATQVHVRVSSPPYKWPCFYGIDTCEQKQLVGSQMDVEGICKHIGADSLGYLSIGGLARAISLPKNIFCLACLNGEYPIQIPEELQVSKFAYEELSEEEQQAFAIPASLLSPE